MSSEYVAFSRRFPMTVQFVKSAADSEESMEQLPPDIFEWALLPYVSYNFAFKSAS